MVLRTRQSDLRLQRIWKRRWATYSSPRSTSPGSLAWTLKSLSRKPIANSCSAFIGWKLPQREREAASPSCPAIRWKTCGTNRKRPNSLIFRPAFRAQDLRLSLYLPFAVAFVAACPERSRRAVLFRRASCYDLAGDANLLIGVFYFAFVATAFFSLPHFSQPCSVFLPGTTSICSTGSAAGTYVAGSPSSRRTMLQPCAIALAL